MSLISALKFIKHKVEMKNKTETAVQSQDDAKNWYGRQNLNLIKKTENPLQDSARFCKILQDSARSCKSLQAFTGH